MVINWIFYYKVRGINVLINIKKITQTHTMLDINVNNLYTKKKLREGEKGNHNKKSTVNTKLKQHANLVFVKPKTAATP